MLDRRAILGLAGAYTCQQDLSRPCDRVQGGLDLFVEGGERFANGRAQYKHETIIAS